MKARLSIPSLVGKALISVTMVLMGCLSASAQIQAKTFPAEFRESSNGTNFVETTLPSHLDAELLRIEPQNLFATNALTTSSADKAPVQDDSRLDIRLLRFLKAGAESPMGWRKVDGGTNTIGRYRVRPVKIHDEQTVSIGRKRNHEARLAFAAFLNQAHPEADESVQAIWFDVACAIWLDADPMHDEPGAPARRRLEDGIPSAGELLSWFAGNGLLSPAVREAARKRLDALPTTDE